MNCPRCGVRMEKTNDVYVCPNCGVIEDNTESTEGDVNYIG